LHYKNCFAIKTCYLKIFPCPHEDPLAAGWNVGVIVLVAI